MKRRLQGRLVTPRGLEPGRLTFGANIESLERGGSGGPYLLPGFIDVHVHGGGGGDTMDGAEGVRALARFHLQRGATTLYPTTMTNPWARIVSALRGVREVMDERDPDLPSIPGAHLEGPFISPQRLGAQPPYALEPTPELLEEVLALDVVRLVTLAPEVPGAFSAARRLAEAGVRVSVGHTAADYGTTESFAQEVRRAGGVVGFTHLYNAMGGLQGREPGVLGAALADPESFAELIFDTHHVYPGAFRAALAAKGETLLFVTDAMRATGTDATRSELGGQAVFIKDGAARLEGGGLAGSVLTLDQALRNASALGLELPLLSRLLSGTPARYLGLADRGTLEPGKRADIVVLDESLNVLEVYMAGRGVVG